MRAATGKPTPRGSRTWIGLGLAWGHLSLLGWSLLAALNPDSNTTVAGMWMHIARWTAGLPVTIVAMLTAQTTGQPLTLPTWAWPLPALLGSAITWGISRIYRRTLSRRGAHAALAVFVSVSLISTVAVAHAADRERVAEELFFSMLETDTDPWTVPGSRAAARTLVRRYPETPWASEAWRLVAIEAEARGDTASAQRAWAAFRDCFGDADPGRALGSLRLAQLTSSEHATDIARAHYLDAYRTMSRIRSGVQGWIGTESARGLEDLARSNGQHATSLYWARERARSNVNDEHLTDEG